MTQDISRAGARFDTAHIYSAGDALLAKIPWGEWERAGEIPARIVRVETIKDFPGPAPLANPLTSMNAIFTSVAVRWDVPAKA
jgi:bifunctional ADP-heptose synthase (sugar kinase/adenylyltransferase)